MKRINNLPPRLLSYFLLISGVSLNVQAGTVTLETSEADTNHQWQIDGKSVKANTEIDVTAEFDASLLLDAKSSVNHYGLIFSHKSDDKTATITANVKTSSAGIAAFQNGLALPPGRNLVYIFGKGAQDKKHDSGAVGPKLDVTVSAPLKVQFDQVTFAGRLQGPTSAYQFRSGGADGWTEGDHLRQAANGSALVVNLQTASGTGLIASSGLAKGSSSLPWRAGAALLNAVSKGGDGYTSQTTDSMGQRVDLSGAGAFGGNVKVTVGKGATLQLGSESDPLTTRADSPVVGVLALSQGGMGGHGDGHMADNGKGGEVDLSFNGALTGNAPYTMGIVAASVGAASEDPSNTQKWLGVSGGGSNVDVQLQAGTIDLASTNVIGLVATSTADNPLGKGDSKPVIHGDPNSYRDVSVSLDANSRITVGNITDKATATDTTIGILANSSVAWNQHPFGGTTPGTQTSPGKAGNITVTNQGTVTASGSQAIGILAQSIAGDGASISGGIFPFVGGSGNVGGTAGNISYVGDGGKITATGDGAIGLHMQSIAGGGGNGGNAAGLFVAVGGKGGAGGTAGTLSLSQKNGGTIITTGDYAQGVLMQSIGGGGGNGGYAKAFSLGTVVTGTVGGSGGPGGTGGDVFLGGLNDAGTDQTGTITTSGQHAHGIVVQTMGSGGGKGGAAHSYDAGTGITVSLAVGGSGGKGANGGDIRGAGGAASGSSIGDVVTTGHDAFGMALQSIGGGGGMGGASTAAAFSALSIPEMPNVTISMSLGGSGGIGGDGGNIDFDLVNDMQTQGASSTGFVMQSIGGGGGIGGDATAGSGSFLANSEFALNTAVAVGGTGGAGGKGGKVRLGLSGTQTTRGHNANAVLVQSIGGGGGMGGVGNAATVVAVPLEEANYSVALGVGGEGGKGAGGGDVTVASRSASVIRTLGSGASGITAQSIGGGGGIAGDAGTQGVGGKLKTQIAAGGDGGSGNNGGKVTVNYSGQISTGGRYQVQYENTSGGTSLTTPIAVGGGSHGIVAQSIGGGGGKAGNADPSKALLPDLAEIIIDDANKLMDAKGTIMWLASRVVNWEKKEHEFPKALSVGVGVGGTGGAGGNGGEVDVSIGKNTTILTQGHRSYGIFAQSVGGGGGEAGSAAGDALVDADIDLSPLTGADFDLAVNVGGKGGTAGNGGNVRVDTSSFGGTASDNFIATSGYGSHAVFMQSVGGGGGVAHEGSIFGLGGKLAGADVPAVTLGSIDASKASSGDGGSIYFGTTNFSVSTVSQVQTAGDDAAAIFAQSIGGGGGVASVGCTNSGRASGSLGASACHTNAGTADSDTPPGEHIPSKFLNGQQLFHLELAGDGKGNGGAITLDPGAGTYATTGDRSPVILAQSIGSGGGYMTADMANLAYATIAGSAKPGGSGGDINIGVSGMDITAAGHGSWGILAQSIGSGGGVVGDLSADLLYVPDVNVASSRKSGTHGGDISVSVTSGSSIIVGQGKEGEDIVNAHAIVAQSLGSSGGIVAAQEFANETMTDRALRFEASNMIDGYGGGISIATSPNTIVETRAIGGVAILAQSGGSYANHDKNGIDISIEGEVIGGRTATNPRTNRKVNGVGVMVSGGGVEKSGFENTITVTKAGSITTHGGAGSGYAIQADYGVTNVDNSGAITGSIDLGSTPGNVTNKATGILNAGASYRIDGSSLDNYGVLNVGLIDTVGTTTIDGRLNQYDSGRTVITVDAANVGATHDALAIKGVANLGGIVEAHAISLLPTDHAIIEASALNFTGAIKQSLLFSWKHQLDGNRLSITPIANFRPAGLGLSETADSLVSYLERGWNRADRGKARLFGYLNHVNGSGHYQYTLDQLGGQHLHAQPQQMLASAYNSFSDGMSCPVFHTPAVRVNGTGCVWARASGNLTDQSANGHNLGYESEGGGLRLGVQRQLDNQWTFGATFGANLNRLSSDGFTSKGEVFDASVSLKRQIGNWSITGALAAAHGTFRNDRRPQLGGVGDALGLNTTYSSQSKMTMVGARVRTAYDINLEDSYLRPYLDLDVMHNRSPAFSESAAGPLGLNVSSVSNTNVAITPMMELGTRYDPSGDTSLRVYASTGVSFLPNNRRTSQNSFIGAINSTGTFNVTTEAPSIVGRLNLGVHMFNKDGLDLNAEYGLQAGSSYRSQNISARLTYRF